MEENKDVVVDETPTAAEKEEQVLEAAGQDTGKTEDGMYKVDLSKPPKTETDAVQEQSTDESVLRGSGTDEKTGKETEVELQDVQQEETQLTLEEVIDEETKEEPKEEVKEEVQDLQDKVEEAVQTSQDTGIELPENIQKVVDFINETGGTLEDYVKINQDYSNIDESTLLYQYYNQTKSHLTKDEIDFLIDDNFSVDEEIDEQRDIKRKKLAYKEEIAKARKFLDDTKSKYYDEIKLRPGVTQEQQKAMDFFNRYNKEQQIAEQRHKTFQDKTNEFFTDDFKGFEFNLGEKKFRYNVANAYDVAEKQSNLNTFVKKFLNNEGEVVDTVGYHKAIYAADNADTIANHFYEQGKADAVKDMMAKSKNITSEPRPQAGGDVFINGLKVKAVTGADSSKLKFKIKK